jgi:AcrR family transcriptional regulator
LRAAQKADTRRRLLEAAMEVFAEKGYAATTVEDSARAAGASTATFYLHFKRKVDVLRANAAAADRGVSYLTQSLRSRARPVAKADLEDWALRLADYWLELRASHQVLGQAVLIEPDLRPLRTQRLLDGIEYWESFLRDFGAEPSPQLTAAAALLNAQIFGLFEMWIVAQVPLDKDLLVQQLAVALGSYIARNGAPGTIEPIASSS